MEQQHLVNEEERLQASERRYDEAGTDLDEARYDVDQWKQRHRDRHGNYNKLDPALLQLEQKVNDAAQRLQIANQALQDARRESDAWIDTGNVYSV